MKKMISFALILLLGPTISFAGHYEYPPQYSNGPYGHHYPPPPYSRGGRQEHYSRGGGYHHNDAWIVPLAIFGTALGVMALSQQYAPPPLPPQRICRDTYNYVDENGRYLYSRYVDRPCD